ncbi:MAG: DUF4838 domain-containing protein [Armatimonadota bacterium]|jgi:hypothetical protein
MKRTLSITALIALSAIAAFGQPVTIVEDGASNFSIVHAPDAPPSVLQAASELQRYIEAVSGAELAIAGEATGPAILLGEAAGLDLSDVPVEGFRIVTREGNVLIAGQDTAGGERTAQGGTSHGTRHGTYEFIERFLNVRWLLPTEIGQDVPEMRTVTVPETDMMDAPFFPNRRLPYIQAGKDGVDAWVDRHRIARGHGPEGQSLQIFHGHNFARTIPAELFDEHPDWFPMFDGQRVPPTGRYKLCLSNPELIDAFAQRAIEYFDERPDEVTFSLSPSDSGGWCRCPDCEAMYETDPDGNLSVTPAVLHFYNGVSRIVAEKYPEKVLAGYVYAAYVYPPSEPIPLEPNFFPVWAPHMDYGYTLFRPELQQTWISLAEQWTALTDRLMYYDLPNYLTNQAGAICSPGLEILEFIYPRLKQYGMQGVYVYGQPAWGGGGPTNYLLAKLAWDPDADIEALFVEYVQRAYHEGAPEIEALYRLLDAEIKRHFIENSDARWTLTPKIMEDVYSRNFDEIERLYRAAEAKITDDNARARLEWMGWNLTILHWNMRQFAMLDEPQSSSFYKPDAEFFDWLSARRDSPAINPPSPASGAAEVERLAVSAADTVPNAEPLEHHLLRGDQHIVILPTDEITTISFRNVTARGRLLQYAVLGAGGEEITAGLVSTEVPIELDAVGSPHYHLLITAGPATFRVDVEGAAWAVSSDVDSKGLHMLGRAATPLYFQVPAGTEAFHLSLEGSFPGETVVGRLIAPDGREVEVFRAVERPIDRKRVSVGPNDAGWWKLLIEEAEVGVLDDYWVNLGNEIPGWLSIDPDRALSVRGR